MKRSLKVRPVPIDKIVVLKDNQHINVLVVAKYYGELEADPKTYLAPIFLRKLSSGYYKIRDGHHRYIATLLHGGQYMDAYIEEDK